MCVLYNQHCVFRWTIVYLEFSHFEIALMIHNRNNKHTLLASGITKN